MAKSKNTYGYSDATIPKQFDFEEIISTHINTTKAILKKHIKWATDQNYWYFDLNAGPGIDEDDKFGRKTGSPIIFLKKAITKKIPSKTIFYENDKKHYASLLNSISTLTIPNRLSLDIDTHNSSNEQLMRYYTIPTEKSYGLIYHDPNGVPNFNLLSRFFKINHPKIDLLINCPCTAIKRIAYSSKKTTKNKFLNEFIDNVNKKHWLIREPYTEWQWSMIIGSNWDHFPNFKKLGFLNKDSPEGQELFKRLVFKKGDKRQTDNKKY